MEGIHKWITESLKKKHSEMLWWFLKKKFFYGAKHLKKLVAEKSVSENYSFVNPLFFLPGCVEFFFILKQLISTLAF